MTDEPHTLLAALARDQVQLELTTFAVCRLAALSVRTDRQGLTRAANRQSRASGPVCSC